MKEINLDDPSALMLTEGSTASPSHWGGIEVRIGGRLYRPGFVPRGHEGRKVMHGPKVPGPWGWISEGCTVIDGRPYEEKHPNTVDAEAGDVLVFEGDRFEIKKVGRRDYYNLERVE